MTIIEKLQSKYSIRIDQLITSVDNAALIKFSNGIYFKHLDLLHNEVDYYTKLEWVLRHSQSAKKILLSSLYLNQASYLYENKMKNLVLYSMYYSLFNAFLSNIILLPYFNVNDVTQISHIQARAKIENYLVRKKIYTKEILPLFSELKMWREAYSYHLPLTGISYDFKDYKKRLELFIPNLYQTSELLSALTCLAWEKRVKTVKDNYSEEQYKCDTLFFSFVNIEDDEGNFFQVDDDDYYRQGYLLKNSNTPMPLSWFLSDRLCEDLECNWEQPENDSDFNINQVSRLIDSII